MMKKFLILLCVSLLTINTFAQKEEDVDFESFDITKVGQQVPDFSFTTLNGKSFKMSELKGKTVLLVFFATWCGPCMKELPRIESEIWQTYKSGDFMVIAFGRQHSMEEIQKFNQTKGFTFTLAPDPEREIYSKFFKQYIPRNVLVNKDGTIIYQKQGYRDEDTKKLKDLIEKELQ